MIFERWILASILFYFILFNEVNIYIQNFKQKKHLKNLNIMNSLKLNVNLNFQQLLEVVKQLSPSEKIKLNEFIWNENIDIPVEHQKLVLDRTQKSKADPSKMLDWDEASKNLKP